MEVKKLIILIFAFIVINACKEDCEENYGKESFYIYVSLNIIDSIEVKSNIKFDKIHSSPLSTAYQRRFTNTDLKNLNLIVYIDNDTTHLNLPIKDDHHLSISLSHSDSNYCLPEYLNERNEWNIYSKKEIQYCYFYRLNGCG
jgi:hypothetical protein